MSVSINDCLNMFIFVLACKPQKKNMTGHFCTESVYSGICVRTPFNRDYRDMTIVYHFSSPKFSWDIKLPSIKVN